MGKDFRRRGRKMNVLDQGAQGRGARAGWGWQFSILKK